MPKKYHIDVHFTPNRFPVIGRSGIVDWGEGCLKCAKCIKTQCIYNVYRERSFSTDIMADTIDELCKSCFRCVQGCPKRLIHKTINPEWEALGDDVYTPETISITWQQAETGKIPVSGAGYGGPYSGPGFDSMWTDMSEIVRPTRDGIHGREYISTVVDIGRRPSFLKFDPDGIVVSDTSASLRIPIPILFDMFPFGDLSDKVWHAAAKAAFSLQTLLIVPQEIASRVPGYESNMVPYLGKNHPSGSWLEAFPMVEIPDDLETLERTSTLKSSRPDKLVAVRMSPFSTSEVIQRILELHKTGVDLIHYVADERGYEKGVPNGLHLKDIIRDIHAGLIQEGIRDEITFMASGGIAMAEHVIKSMLCGANLVGVDVPLLIGLECRVCRNCRDGGKCPVTISGIEPNWGAERIINLIGAWHNQLLEMMGAMGIREARRLRGEQGRIMFFEDLEAETFGRMFSSTPD